MRGDAGFIYMKLDGQGSTNGFGGTTFYYEATATDIVFWYARCTDYEKFNKAEAKRVIEYKKHDPTEKYVLCWEMFGVEKMEDILFKDFIKKFPEVAINVLPKHIQSKIKNITEFNIEAPFSDVAKTTIQLHARVLDKSEFKRLAIKEVSETIFPCNVTMGGAYVETHTEIDYSNLIQNMKNKLGITVIRHKKDHIVMMTIGELQNIIGAVSASVAGMVAKQTTEICQQQIAELMKELSQEDIGESDDDVKEEQPS